MRHAPFATREARFSSADDVTDEAAFDVLPEFGGIGLLGRPRTAGTGWRVPRRRGDVRPLDCRRWQEQRKTGGVMNVPPKSGPDRRDNGRASTLAVYRHNSRTGRRLVNPLARIVCGGAFRVSTADPVFCRLLAGDEEKGFTDVCARRIRFVAVGLRPQHGRGHDRSCPGRDGSAVRVDRFRTPNFNHTAVRFRPPTVGPHHRADLGPAAHHDPFPPRLAGQGDAADALGR